MDDFFAADVRRWTSRSTDYGVEWRDDGRSGPTWRVTYIQGTGEVYAVNLAPPGRVRMLGLVPADDADIWYWTLHCVLGNYANPDENENFSLAWVTRRLQQWAAANPARVRPA